VSDAEFDAIFERVKKARLSYVPGASTTASSMTGMAAEAFISRTQTVTYLS